MPFLIDGHNLIGKYPHLNLDDLDDEQALIEILQEYCRHNDRKAEVYFDKASPGGARAQVHGRVTVRYVREGDTADHAIARHLKRLENEAANWTVVSSDLEVIASAKRAKARSITAEEFTTRLTAEAAGAGESEDPALSKDEIDEWMGLFGEE
ncbi:MAG: NYN domain-containing protein [Anaerolineae bacterium]|nr:NYN domain-containing protein [Anaerolineae bacterium]